MWSLHAGCGGKQSWEEGGEGPAVREGKGWGQGGGEAEGGPSLLGVCLGQRKGTHAPAARPKPRAAVPSSDGAGSGPALPPLARQPHPHPRWQPFGSAHRSLCWAERSRIPCPLPASTAPQSGLPNLGAGPSTAARLLQPTGATWLGPGGKGGLQAQSGSEEHLPPPKAA